MGKREKYIMQTEYLRKLSWISWWYLFFYKTWLILGKAGLVRVNCLVHRSSLSQVNMCYFKNLKAHILASVLLLCVRTSFDVRLVPWNFWEVTNPCLKQNPCVLWNTRSILRQSPQNTFF